MSKNNISPLDSGNQTKVKEASPTIAAPLSKSTSAPQRRNTMQMKVNLYPDQIEWLNQIVNRGYESSKKIISKEQVISAIIDALAEKMNGNLPTDFSNEKGLQIKLLALLESS